MNKYGFRIILAGLIVLGLILVGVYGLKSGFAIESLASGTSSFSAFTRENLFYAVLVYMLIVILFTAVFTPSMLILTIAGGYLFGFWIGGISANISIAIGSVLALLSSRYILHDLVRHRLKKQARDFDRHFQHSGKHYLLSVRLVPIIPGFVINLAAGLTKVHIRTFFWTTLVGNLPADLIYSYAGSQIRNVESFWSIFSPPIFMALSLLGVASLVPIWVKRRGIELD
jgi:uncharacterized membrane protein YdjX (TVP38/TMEM64 family)